VANGDTPGPGEARASCESETARAGVTTMRAGDEPLLRGDAEGILAAPVKPSIERWLQIFVFGGQLSAADDAWWCGS
jgi:hypothetical protein